MSRKKIAPERKKEIIDGFYKCLANTGHEQVTIKDIAKAADLSHGVIHYYFDSKKDIMLAVVQDFIERTADLMKERMLPLGSAWERLEAFVSYSVERLVLDREVSMFFLNFYQMAMTDADIRSGAVLSYSHFRGIVCGIAEYGIERGEFALADDGAEEFAFYFVSCIEGMWLQLSMDPTLFSKEEIERILMENARRRLSISATAG
jgi:AcrR family transcriptional regulator